MMTANAASAARQPSILAQLAHTPLARAGGAVLTRLLDDGWLASLRHEAAVQAALARPNERAQASAAAAAAGDPERRLESAPAGPVLDTFYHAPMVLELLASLTGLRWTTTGERGSYSYYRLEGHHLGLHLDIDTCDIALITCIADDGVRSGGVLELYPGRVGVPLAEVRRSLDRGAVPIRLEVGQSIVLLGGLVPHRLTPVGPNQTRIISPLCYRVAGQPSVA
jgi:hypothetical protein